ncbi:hypothetical protein VTP01DRAFT_9239 [Rhizomucor pusillus]|uniref:uncharacterized protein n=1 Tax=Rhizomucor pusillus TaxID=4840 RepID=UPI0037426802
MLNNEENTEQKLRDDISTTVEGGTQGWQKQPFQKSKTEKTLQRKIDLMFLPLVLFIIMLGSIYFLGYLVYQTPNQFLIQWFPIGKYPGVCVIILGAVTLCTALDQNFSQLVALRFLLGIFEASCYHRHVPGVWILGREPGDRRHCQYGKQTWHRDMAMEPHHLRCPDSSARHCDILFVDKPKSKLLKLTLEQEKIVDERTQDNAVVRSKKFNRRHVIESLCELRTQFLQTLGNLTTTETILLKVPGSVASTIFPLASGLIARRTQQPMYTGILMCVISLAGCIVLACVPSGAVKLVGCYLN